MVLNKLDGNKFEQMIIQASSHLANNKEMIDALNVFPVPDGDTGTNMNLTFSSGTAEMKKASQKNVGSLAAHLAKGLLMGARGNSGVILSQLFRGFSKAVENKEALTPQEFAKAFDSGVETAYKAVIKPVEGTILTVAKDAARKSVVVAKTSNNVIEVMEETLAEAKASLLRTPDLLPVLKEVGVVDSGGQGLVTIYEAFLAVLEGKAITEMKTEEPDMEDMIRAEHHKAAQAHLQTDEIEYGYCTEFMVRLQERSFDEHQFRHYLNEQGDSLLVVSDEELVKVHIHTEKPGNLLTYAQNFGELINIKIENMREQHSEIVSRTEPERHVPSNLKKKPFGFVTVASGDGIVELFKSLGEVEVIHGGQTMNPSTEDILTAIGNVNTETVFVLPNNSNIMMAAEQAGKVASNQVIVIPTKSISQGLAAMFAFHADESAASNEKMMNDAIKSIKSGQVTYAVRDSVIDGFEIKQNDFLSILEDKIISSSAAREDAVKHLLENMIMDDNELATIIYGKDVTEEEAQSIETYLQDTYPDVEVELQSGKQPVYSYLISVE